MRGRFGWIGAGVLLLGIVAIFAVGFAALGGTDLLAGAGTDKTDRAVEPTGAKKDPPKAAQEPEKQEQAASDKEEAKKEEPKKEEPKEEESKKDEPDEELSNEEQVEVADSFSAPKEAAEASASASASAAASAPADTTMSLDVPAIGLSGIPVYEGTGEASLSAGTGHLSGTGYPWVPGSNTYVAGHRVGYPGTASDYVFWDLPSLGMGDEVYLTDANGKTYTYAVSEILEVPITDLSVTEPVGRDIVSLQTCIENYGDYWTEGPNWNVRYVVRADKV